MKLKCDVLLSTSAFKFNLRRYIVELPDVQFLLMSATFGDTTKFSKFLARPPAPAAATQSTEHFNLFTPLSRRRSAPVYHVSMDVLQR